MRRRVGLLVIGVLLAAACGDDAAAPLALTPTTVDVPQFPPAPPVPEGDLAPSVIADLDSLFGTISTDVDHQALARLGDADDVRVAWPLTDILRFVNTGQLYNGAVESWEALTGVVMQPVRSNWNFATDHLIAWDIPAPPGYLDWKRELYQIVEPRWAPLFDDPEATIDWRLIAWGGVRIDDRPPDRVDRPCPRGCIPALDDPALTPASGGDWYPDDAIVFGVVVNGEAVAFPKNIMEVHEMVNMTIGGRRIGMPYCTLCGAAQAYFTDDVPAGVDLDGATSFELRTSGLLNRSNKVMFDFHTFSAFDTFTGEAVSGPLREAGVRLEQTTVRTSTWANWRTVHPETRIVAEDGGLGRAYDTDPLRGRDDNGPIFPIGDIDPRLPVQAPVLGVIAADGTPIAFPVDALDDALASGDEVSFGGARISSDGAGFTASDPDGDALAAHQAFWFAWSQFHPDTLLWSP